MYYVCLFIHIIRLVLMSRRWVNVPAAQTISGSPTSRPSSPNPSLDTYSSSSSSQGYKKPSTVLAGEKSETLSIKREEVVKGVIIKGIVCNPKERIKSRSNSLNPFETKRTAPKPPNR